ncbi:MAG: carboxypeptidase-like regulatory domain-containing protein, partial [Maioricimonas sp. JB049]
MRCFCLVLALMVTGCTSPGGDAPELVEYTGTVTLDGQPLPDAAVMFHPTQSGLNGAAGQTNSNGEFTLVTGRRTAVMPGSYKETDSLFVAKDGSSDS